MQCMKKHFLIVKRDHDDECTVNETTKLKQQRTFEEVKCRLWYDGWLDVQFTKDKLTCQGKMAKASIPFAEILEKTKTTEIKRSNVKQNKKYADVWLSFLTAYSEPHLDGPLYHRDVGIGYGTS